jgi:AraC family transcriptional regulator
MSETTIQVPQSALATSAPRPSSSAALHYRLGDGRSPYRRYFGGAMEASYSCSGVSLSQVLYRTKRSCRPHCHGRAFFALLLRGGYRESWGPREIAYQPYTLAFHPSGMSHADETCAKTRFFLIELGDPWVRRLQEYAPSLTLVPDTCGREATCLAMRLYAEFRRAPACSPLLVEGIALEMLASMARAKEVRERHKPRWLQTVIDLLQAEFAHNWTLEEIAGQVDVHPVHLSRVFRKTYGETLGQYLNRIRVRYASQKLSTSDAPLSDVALSAGFYDQSHFTRIFKQLTGTTPGLLRRVG